MLPFLKLHWAKFPAKLLLSLASQGITADDIAASSSAELKKLQCPAPVIQRLQKFEASLVADDVTWLQEDHHHLVTIVDDDYPILLKEIERPPLSLFVMGDKTLLRKPQVAMVGSRNPTKVGKDLAKAFAGHLIAAGAIITSGMATGIDSASHGGALAVDGKTIAVCGTGLNRVYPAAHRQLARDISESGALVSEYFCNTGPKPYHFPERNRIISGLALGTLVVEAALKSGSLITARLAAEQGREVFAIPGSVHNPLARGCHQLIRNGAKLVETGNDIVEELAILADFNEAREGEQGVEKPKNDLILDNDYELLLQAIGFETTAVDDIVARSAFSMDTVASMLLI